MPEYLRLWLSYNRRREPKKIELKAEEVLHKEVIITASKVLRHVKDFLFQGNESLSSYITIWIERRGIRQNLFKLRKNKTEIRLPLSENGFFQLNVLIEDGSEKNNLIKNFQLNYQGYKRLKHNIEKVIQQSKQEEVGKDINSSRPIDIAYFFADPLVAVYKKGIQKKLTTTSQNEVSYQVEYDQFIQMIKKEEFRLNFRVEMMVATQTNIKNTLIEGASLLHFACHGNSHGCLQIQNEKLIGELANLTPDRFMDLLENKTLPKAIIFNVCHSYDLAKRINQEKKIITIGYKGKVKDQYCEKFTKEFYIGLFRDGRPIRQIFREIKESIVQIDPEQGNKLNIFPEDELSADEFKLAEPKAHYKQYVIRWSILESLRGNDCLGVKKQMHQFIQKLINDERMSYMFLEGDKNSGKTSLISKLKIYVLNRKTFTDQLVFDLKKPNGELIETMLELRLAIQSLLIVWRSEMLKKAKERRVACLVIFDHAQKIMAFQYSELTAYVEEQIRDKIKYGKIVIITRLEQPLGKKDALSYSRANKHTKKPASIQEIEYSNFVSRYWEPYKKQAERLTKTKNIAMIDLVKAIKTAHSPSKLEQAIENVRNSPPSPEPKFIEQHEVFQEYIKLNSQTERLLKDIDIEVAQNHHLYISTILEQIADRIHINKNHGPNKSQSKEELKQKKMEDIGTLVDKFKEFYQRIMLHQQTEAIQSFKKITRLSLKIAGLCYLFDCEFERQLLHCEKMYVMASVMLLNPFFEVPRGVHRRQSQGEQEFMSTNIEGRQLEQLLKQYKLKVLLTLYTYYTQCSFKLLQNQERDEQRLQFLEDKSKKVEIAMDQLYRVIQKRSKEHQIYIKQSFIKKYSLLNKIIQQLRYSPDGSHLVKPQKNHNRKNSDVVGLYNEMTDVQPLIQTIHSAHKKIEEYWRFYEQLKEVNSTFEILSKDSIVIMLLSLIKLINFNQSYLQTLESIGQNYIKRQMHGYFTLYLKIMQWIDQSQIFAKETKSHSEYVIWQFPNMRSIKELFRRYFRMYIDVYFHVEKLHQNLTKKYQIKIFNHLLQMCVTHPKIKLQSLKKEIENHKDQQFLSNYNCSTYIALPLLKFKSLEDNYGNRVNLKRYQSHIYRFQEHFFSTLDRQIKHDIYSLSRDFFTLDQEKTKSLIQLIILNCSDSAVQCESMTGKGEVLRIRHITCVPKAPVVILFGSNVKGLIGTFRTLNNCSVLITIDLGSDQNTNERDFLEKNVAKQNFKLKEQRIDKLEQYSSKLQISYSVLQFFYTSFCKHFFSVDHAFFIEQVKNSYHLAKAEAFIKTKIRLQTSPNYGYSDYIRQRIENIDLSVSEQTFHEMRSKPAYHFMFKQYRLEHFARTLTDLTKKDKREIQPQIGCNRQICELLHKILKAQKSCNFVYLYKSKQMLEFFQNTLIAKLKKYKNYDIIIADLAAPDSLDLSRVSSGTVNKSNVFDLENEQETKDHNKKIMIFQDLKDGEFIEEIKMMSDHEPVTIRLFFSNFRYKQMPQEFNEECVMENYNSQKIEFQLYFIDCKVRRHDLSAKNAMKAFKKVIDQQYASLHQIKRELQSRNH